jgi:hypothetical protein
MRIERKWQEFKEQLADMPPAVSEAFRHCFYCGAAGVLTEVTDSDDPQILDDMLNEMTDHIDTERDKLRAEGRLDLLPDVDS